MKKLMIAAAIVCAAALSQAATISWSLSNVQEDGTGVNGVMYFFANEKVAQATILALEGQGASAVQSALDAITTKATWTVADGTGTIASSDSHKPTNAQLGLADSTTYNFYALVFDTATITDKSNFYVTGLKSAATAGATNNKNVGLGNQLTPSNADGAWHAVGAVPEPTSALLLLLGVAGLALRRRRA